MARNFTTVCASGYFDPLHTGHIQYLKNAKLLGDELVVILNNDQQRSTLHRLTYEEQKIILESIRWADRVIIAIDTDKTVCKTLEKIHPSIFAKGGCASEEETRVCQTLGSK